MNSSECLRQTITVIDDAGALPVSLESVREHCRAPEAGDDDTLLDGMAFAAAELIGLRCGLTLPRQTVTVGLERWPCGRALDLDIAPVRDVVAVAWRDADGVLHPVTDFQWVPTRAGARVILGADVSIGPLADRPDAVTLEVDVGFNPEGASDGDVRLRLPRALRMAVLMLTAHWYDNRGVVVVGQSVDGVEFTLDALISAHRIFR